MASKSTLRVHVKRHNLSAPYICCGQPFYSNTNYKRHRCQQHGETKEFACSDCGALFAVMSDLKRHMRRKANDFINQCEICGATFEAKSKLLDHKETHSVAPEKRHVCLICNKAFQYRTSLSRHNLKHTEESFKCHKCGKLFNSQQTLDKHYRKQHSTEVVIP